MNSLKTSLNDLKYFIILWLSQSFSALGSAMTNFALVIWSYQQYGSALITALIAICSYAPYVIMSIFAGALSDRWNKKITMLICDTFAALCTVCILLLLQMGKLEIWHIYVLNALNGLMNTVQKPSADVTISLLTPKKYYQRVSGMRAFSNSLTSVLTPVLATALLSLIGMHAVIWFDLFSFGIAFLCLVFFIKIPEIKYSDETKETLLESTKSGLKYLIENRGILDLILFLAGINLIASMYNSALPAMILSKDNGGEIGLGIVNASIGIATLVGSVVVSILPAPKSRVKVICNTLLFSMSTENFFLAFGNSIPLWSIGAVLGWLFIPMMGANMDVLFRNHIPVEMQGRVYAARNTLQFFTIPIGYFLGGVLVDQVFEPFMNYQNFGILNTLFGKGKGSGAAFLFLFLAFAGIGICLFFKRDRHLWSLEEYSDKCSSVNANDFTEIAE